ncbi:MAG: hypothetical protein HN348_27535 [Proteobacteria bacterium]|nr:hypothetical protein [Pseudomonadota bacterium]
MLARCIPAVLLCACVPELNQIAPEPSSNDQDGPDIEYVLGVDPATGMKKVGGAHEVIDFGYYREAVDYYNEGTLLHPELDDAAYQYDASATSGATDWPVFASSWWPQSENGIAQRYTSVSTDISDHSDQENLAPVEKYDLLFHPGEDEVVDEVEHWYYSEILEDEEDRGNKHSHPEVTAIGPATAWELEEHGVYQSWVHPDSWWGHCNGWASYATTEPGGAPERDIWVKVDNGDIVECQANDSDCVLFRMGDIEALMTELYFSDTSTFAGQRCDLQPDDIDVDADGRPEEEACRDINPATFHTAVVGMLHNEAEHLGTGQIGHPAFVIDHNYDYEVWNFPLTEFEVNDTEDLTEAEATALVGTGSDYKWNVDAEKFVRIDLTYGMVSDSVSSSSMLTYAHDRNIALYYADMHYVLELDANDKILGGEWIEEPNATWGDNSKEGHPDFLWMGVSATGYGENSDDTSGTHDNPHISYDDVRALLDCANDSTTCEASTSSNNNGNGSNGNGNNFDCGQACSGSSGTPWILALLPPIGLIIRRRRNPIHS